MNFRRRIRGDDVEINLIPMIDLLLVILIFLMVTTTYTRFAALKVNLPSAGVPAQEASRQEIVVTVGRDGRTLVGDTPVSVSTAAALAARLRDAAAGVRDPSVVIRADAAASHQSVVHVMEAARIAGYARVAFIAATPGGARR